jgi:hypothetical protein
MNKDDLLREFGWLAGAMHAKDPLAELAIHRHGNFLREHGIEEFAIKELEDALRAPEKLQWKPLVLPPPPRLDWQPTQTDIDFVKARIDSGVSGWFDEDREIGYAINHDNKTFKLIRMLEHKTEVHERTRNILELLGWRMIDYITTTIAFVARTCGWQIIVIDFSIEEQINGNTGDNFPPGSRGQEATASGYGTSLRLGHDVGRALIKGALPEFGQGKTSFQRILSKE